MSSRALLRCCCLRLAACLPQAPDEPRFPKAHRDVAPIVGDAFRPKMPATGWARPSR